MHSFICIKPKHQGKIWKIKKKLNIQDKVKKMFKTKLYILFIIILFYFYFIHIK